jgi:hypothetical protein
MSKFRVLVTDNGKHPASKWAELAANDIIEISAQAPDTLMREAMLFRAALVAKLTEDHQKMMDHEQDLIKKGKHSLDLPYETEDHACKVVEDICKLAKGTSFAKHFDKPEVHAHLEFVCNRYFKSAKLVERQHYHTEKARAAAPSTKPKKSAH